MTILGLASTACIEGILFKHHSHTKRRERGEEVCVCDQYISKYRRIGLTFLLGHRLPLVNMIGPRKESSQSLFTARLTLIPNSASPASAEIQSTPENDIRFPRSVQAVYLRPLRREAKYGVPSCDLQMRSYSVRNLEFFADFALRAAYYLNLPAYGPTPLPRHVERWTVPASHFVHKKSQENFERITMRRLIQIKDGHPETVQIWLAFLKKHAYYGIGMKANVWEYNELGRLRCSPWSMLLLMIF